MIGTTGTRNSQMRALLYLMLSRDGGCKSQKVRTPYNIAKVEQVIQMQALVDALDSAADENEERVILVYIAFTESPQSQMVSGLEERIGDNVYMSGPLLLAYGALVSRATPALQQRMTLFLLNRLPHAETNTTSLLHHIFSLGNTESQLSSDSLINYLRHPDEHVQLSSIHALRYATGDAQVQKALFTLASQSNVTQDTTSAILHCLISGLEHASTTHSHPPFNRQLALSLVSSVSASGNSKLYQTLLTYLKLIDNEDSHHLLNLMPILSINGTRLQKRGSNWAESKHAYDLVAPLSSRLQDLSSYPIHQAYIWGKKFGCLPVNLLVEAGGFTGAASNGNYKVFGRAKSVANVLDKTRTALDIVVLRERGASSIQTKLFVHIAGKTLLNIDITSHSTICTSYNKDLLDLERFLLFKFDFPIPILVANFKVKVSAYVSLKSELNVNFCERVTSVEAEVGLENSITLEVEADVTAKVLVRILLCVVTVHEH